MKKLFALIALFTLSFATIQAQSCDKDDSPRFQNRGERMLSLNGLNIGGATRIGQPIVNDQFGITATYGKFYRDKKMRGLRVGYQSLSSVATNLSGYLFKRNYTGTGRVALYSEIGIGLASNQSFVATPTAQQQQISWYDAHADAKLGASLRLGRRIGLEIDGGLRLNTENAFTPEQLGFSSGWVSSMGISYFLN
ncbi:MAG: hypothetical protein AAGM67_06425 [Bacteroidota bacterium]